ncbi:MAG: starch-binding protein [Ruminococcus sp.]
MFKKIISLVLALMVLASMAAIVGSVSAADTKIYFEVPSNWSNYSKVFCHIWVYGGDALANWQSKKETCTDEGNGIYSYDISKVGGLTAGEYYGVIFSVDTGLQTYDTLMGAACYGDTLYSDGTTYENPQDSSKTALAAFWKNQSRSAYGPIMQVTSIGNLVGTCIAPGQTAETLFTTFLNDNLDNARTYSGKSDQDIIDDMAKGLGLSQDSVEKLIKDAGITVDWKKEESKAPEKNEGIAANPNATATGQEMTVVYIGVAMMIVAAAVVVIARKKRVTE